MFYNYTNEDFEVKWDNKPYIFKAGEVRTGVAISTNNEDSVPLNETVSRVFAHHLAAKVMNSPSLDINFTVNSKGEDVSTFKDQMSKVNFTNMEKLIERAVKGPEEAVELPSFTKDLPLMEKSEEEAIEPEEPKAEAPKKRGRKPKEEASPSPEAEFDV
jgi:hypothetical protein